MHARILLTSTLWLLFQAAPPTLPTVTGPIRNTFAVAVETVIDNASAVDVKADEIRFNAQFQQLKASKDNLAGMAYDDREKDIAARANDMLFQISACHIQAKDGASTTQCESQIAHAQSSMMEAIGKHKTGRAWTDGPPS
jgi:hypothetical protein